MKTQLKILVLIITALFFACTKAPENGIGAPTLRGNCWCTEGMDKMWHLVHYPDAGLWTETTLAPAGNFIRAFTPSVNDIAVSKGGYHSSSAGHVAMIKKIVQSTDGYTITFWGTNQTANETLWNDECGCNNFSEWTFKVYNDDISSGKIKFFHNSSPSLHCGTLFPIGGGIGNTDTRVINISGNLAFGDVIVGQNTQRNITVTPSGTAPLTITSINFPTGFNGSFSGQISSGQTVSIPVTFSPTSVQSYSGTITFNSNATGGSNMISASGNGISSGGGGSPTRVINLSGNLNFGGIDIGQSSQRNITVTPSGTAPLTITSINFPTGFNGSFSGQISPGQTVSIPVTFSPTSVQSYSGTITFNSNATGGSNMISASGNGISAVGGGPVAVPAVGSYGNCTSIGSSSCSATTIYSTGTINARIVSINTTSHQIVIEIKKCNGTPFNAGGYFNVVSGLCTGISYGFLQSFPSGSSTVQITVVDNNMVGSKIYYPFIGQGVSLYSAPPITVIY